jgi:ferredoxin
MNGTGVGLGGEVCVGICAEVFELHDDGYITVLVSEVPPEIGDLVHWAASQRPAQAISLSGDASG